MVRLAELLAEKKHGWDALAKKSGLAIERIHRISEGGACSLKEMRALANALHVPLSAFSINARDEKIKVLFRQNVSKRDTKAESNIEILSADMEKALGVARGMPTNSEWLSKFSDLPPKLEFAEHFAIRFRKLYFEDDQLGPALNLPKVSAEDLGVFVLFSNQIAAEGASALVEGYAFVFLAPRKFRPRMLFTLAHEIGHLLARHHEKDKDFATYDRERKIGTWSFSQRHDEKFADTFASSLLMPRNAVALMLRKVRETLDLAGPLGDLEISFLARFFGVSFEVAGRRCEMLDLLPPFGARALYDHLAKSHINPERRADKVGLPKREPIEFPPSPRLLEAARKQLQNGTASIGRVAEALHLPIEMILASNAESRG